MKYNLGYLTETRVICLRQKQNKTKHNNNFLATKNILNVDKSVRKEGRKEGRSSNVTKKKRS